MRRARFALLGLALTLTACSSRGGGTPGDIASSRSAPRNPRVISTEDIQEAMAQNIGNAYDIVAHYHPQWLQPSITSITGRATDVSVWQDNMRLGGPTALRQVPLSHVVQIRYLTPSEAQGQLGLNNLGGAIVIVTIR